MKPLRINKEEAVLVVVDFQERLMPVMKDSKDLEKAAVKLIEGCKVLGIPTVVTQQYTKGLGPTVAKIHEALGDYSPIEKTSFSSMGEPVFAEELSKTSRKTVILAGIETHVCILQTALDLVEAGYSVFLVKDCVSSRSGSDKKYAIMRMVNSGVTITTYESVLFELLKGAKEEGFKDISNLVK
jgi:nicotinamidase-related amidase